VSSSPVDAPFEGCNLPDEVVYAAYVCGIIRPGYNNTASLVSAAVSNWNKRLSRKS
jgi:hypothetical protein